METENERKGRNLSFNSVVFLVSPPIFLVIPSWTLNFDRSFFFVSSFLSTSME